MRLAGRVARWVGAGLESLRRLDVAQRLWQMGVIILQAGGFNALQATIQGWLSGSQGAALAITKILPTYRHVLRSGRRGGGRPASY